ncbi:hypothetical protein P3W85_29665, partial [Cupriavidus basilensis]|nr:hypothetical protein [Cupriavidus basilensis]
MPAAPVTFSAPPLRHPGPARPASVPRAQPGHVQARNGMSLFVRDWHDGAPSAKAVVFLASWALPSDSWGPQMHALRAAGLRCIAPRAHGDHDVSSPLALSAQRAAALPPDARLALCPGVP